MPSHNVNSPRGAAWGSGTNPPDIEGLVRQGRVWLKQMLPSGGPSGLIIVAVLAVA